MHSSTRGLAYFAAAVCLLLPPGLSAAGTRILAGHVPAAVASARKLGPLSPNTELRLAIGLPLRNQAELDTFLAGVSDPASPHYRAYLSSDEFTRRFGPTESDYRAVVAFAESHGLKVAGTHPNRMILDVTGAVSDIQSAFNIELAAWSAQDRGSFFAPDREPSIDDSLPILDITGLDNYVTPRPMNLKSVPMATVAPDAATGSGPSGLLIGNDFRAAYAPGVKLTGTGQTIGLFELDGFYAADVKANFTQAGLPAVPVQTVLLDGFSGAPGSGNVEVVLDIMMAAYMAPGAKIVVYEGTNWNDVLNRMATDNLASQLSSSWGFSPINSTTEQIFKQFIAQGQSLFQASGDDGAYTNGVMSPSDDPNLTVVGGTHLYTSGPGGTWIGEGAWSGSGGGVSRTYAIPSYQQSVKMSAIGGSSTMRNIPDVALTADIQMFLVANNGQAISVGGTSAAAPLWAGFLALVNQQALTGTSSTKAAPVGFINPALYALAEGSQYTTDMHDITSGGNGFSTAIGYDLVTGWGSPAGQSLINQLTGAQSTPSFSLSAAPASVSLAQGATATTSVSITPISGFSGSVALTVTGLPAGVTASFSSATATSSSTLTFTASASAAVGTSTVTVTGKSGAVTGTFTIALSVTSPASFTLSASPSTLSVVQGNATKTTVTLSAVNGFSGTVTVGVTGLPSGVTATLTRGTTSTTLALSLSASLTATPGTSNISVTGTSGSLTQTATIALTVTAVPSFSLVASPASVSVAQGASASGGVAVAALNGFSGTVSLSASGLPAGVTAQIGAINSSGAATVTFSASASAVSGPSTVTITGTSGTITKTANITLNITGAVTYALSASPATLTVTAGGTVGSTVTVTPQNGFTGKVSLSASGLPSGVTALFGTPSTSATSTVTFVAASSAVSGTAAITITGTSGTLTKTTTVSLSVFPAADFSLTFPQGTLNILQGTSGTGIVSTTALNGFTGTVTLAASGLPAGVTATFAHASDAMQSITLAVSGTAAKGSATITITGTSGSLSHKATLNLNVLAETAGDTAVSLASSANIQGVAIDTVPFTGGGLDNGGRSWSGSLLGASQTIGGVVYAVGPMGGMSAVSGTTVTLPSGTYTALKMLATGLNGNQASQTFVVNYSDGTKSTFTQSLSDWATPQNYSGESTALSMPYRDNSTGTIDGRSFMLYGYSFTLTPGKTVKSIVLPNNRNVAVLAITLTGASTAASTTGK